MNIIIKNSTMAYMFDIGNNVSRETIRDDLNDVVNSGFQVSIDLLEQHGLNFDGIGAPPPLLRHIRIADIELSARNIEELEHGFENRRVFLENQGHEYIIFDSHRNTRYYGIIARGQLRYIYPMVYSMTE